MTRRKQMQPKHLEILQRILADESQLEAFVAMLDAEKVEIYETGNQWTGGFLDGIVSSISKESKLDLLEYLKTALRSYAGQKET